MVSQDREWIVLHQSKEGESIVQVEGISWSYRLLCRPCFGVFVLAADMAHQLPRLGLWSQLKCRRGLPRTTCQYRIGVVLKKETTHVAGKKEK